MNSNVKPFSFLFISLFILLTSCSKEIIETDPESINCEFVNVELHEKNHVLTPQQEQEYLETWKAEFLRVHGLAEQEFSSKVAEYKVSSSSWDGGISFRVDYIVNFGWLEIATEDEFFVWINGTWDVYPQHNLPRDQWLDATWIRYCLENEIYYLGITPVNWESTLQYENCEEAVIDFRVQSGFNMEVDRVSFYVPGNLPRENGDPYLIGFAEIDLAANECAKGNLNLVSGVEESYQDACIQ